MLSIIQQRYAVRNYQDRPVEEDKLRECLEAARLAPSACNMQSWKFVVVNDPAVLHPLQDELCDPQIKVNLFVHKVPVFIAVIKEEAREAPILTAAVDYRGRDYRDFDLGLACENLCLEAVNQGLGTVIIGWYNQQRVSALLGVPDGKVVDVLIAIGYPDKPIQPKKGRKPWDETVSFNRY